MPTAFFVVVLIPHYNPCADSLAFDLIVSMDFKNFEFNLYFGGTT